MADEKNTVDQANSCRQLRARCKNKMFSEDMWLVSKDEEDCSSNNRKVYFLSYNLPDKLKNPKYLNHGYVQEINGYHFSVDFLDRNGFIWPMLIQNKQSLGLKVPDSKFGVNDVRRCVGSNRIVDVINVYTQKNVQMSMKEFQKYYEQQDRKNLFNIISLEFSHTKLEKYVTQPGIVRKLDWVDLYWPKSLKSKQMDSTNIMKNMMYPKVKKYCLMSVKGCYTDFHVDFGGTSVWYHILKGVKVFWLIRPTDENLEMYQRWLLADKQMTQINQYTFLGDVVDKCERVILKAGQTFFIPSGWIHAVYTPKDSLVFGGNFLHSYSIDMQIKIARHEDNTHIMKKFRYPYFTEMHWYALDGILRRLIKLLNSNVVDSSYLDSISNGDTDNPGSSRSIYTKKAFHLLNGMKTILDYLNDLPVTRKCIPERFYDHTTLLRDARYVFNNYKNILEKNFGGDNVCKEIVNKFNDSDFEDNGHTSAIKTLKRKLKFADSERKEREKKIRAAQKQDIAADNSSYKKHLYRRRRTRCRTCEACVKDDCGTCIYCKDMIKFGGNGRAKQSCISRQCLQPVLPSSSNCIVCNTGSNLCTDEEVLKTGDPDAGNVNSINNSNNNNNNNNDNMASFMQTVMNSVSKNQGNLTYINDQNLLMECAICYEIVHPRCLFNRLPDCLNYDIANNINDDLPNSWKCPKCYSKKANDKAYYSKQRFFKARGKVINNMKYSLNEFSRMSAESSDNTATSSQEDLTTLNM